jgi:alanyl-tRNA synthetase
MPTANEIRQQFIDFFVKQHGHTFVPSSSVVPLDDPTLMFTNAGMNQFKDVFLGTGTRPYKRAVNSQKCIRVSGKHNDLEEVGRDTYHHTFFEMLGNWSFGDYYKAEAIRWAWDLLTKVWGIDKSRLYATVFGGDTIPASGDASAPRVLEPDEEAFKLWTQVTDIDKSHVQRFGKKDNFWMMGETGPCGPCSEIHIDRTPDKSGGKLVNAGDARVMEIWNLVFIQYNRDDAGKLTLLPAKHVDTGMGFERVTAVLQGKESNYDTDVFKPIMDEIGRLTGKRYGGKLDDLTDIAFRVIADHLRMLTFSIADGALPSNKGRGSVMRSVLRRAVRFGWQRFDQREPFIYKLVPVLVAHMGGAFPEMKKNFSRVSEIIKGEEAEFLRTIERGLSRFVIAAADAVSEEIARCQGLRRKATTLVGAEVPRSSNVSILSFEDKAGKDQRFMLPAEPDKARLFVQEHCQYHPTISAKAIFNLHTTDGFPPDLTQQMAEERGLIVDMQGYEHLMKEHEDLSRGQATTQQVALNVTGGLPETDDRPKWFGLTTEGRVLGWIDDNQFVQSGRIDKHKPVGLLLDRTCFYAEQGGQVGDQGSIITPTGSFHVEQTTKVGNAVVHVGHVSDGWLEAGQSATLTVDPVRDFTRKNHTTTHLLHWALRTVLGEHVEQRGSKVKPDEFTFDFAHTGPLSEQERHAVEKLVNEKIYEDLPVKWRELPIQEARNLAGVRAFFGDKYGDVVRVVEIGDGFSREFCGGTHLEHTGQAGFFKITGEEAVGKGVRRLIGVTGREAVAQVQKLDSVVGELTTRFRCKPEELSSRIEGLEEQIKKLQTQLKKGAAGDLQSVGDKLLAGAANVNGASIIVGEMPAGPEESLRNQVDRLKQKAGSAVIVVGWNDDGKVGLIAAVTDDLVKKGLHAGKLVGQVAKVVGGGGGGKPTMAQAGGKEPAKLAEALELAGTLIRDSLAKS